MDGTGALPDRKSASRPSADRRTIAGMSDSIFLVGDDGSVTEAAGTPYSAEAELQEYNRHETLEGLTAELRGLGIPRLDAEPDLPGKRPNIPLEELTSGRTERLLSLVDKWIDEVRAHAGEPETADES